MKNEVELKDLLKPILFIVLALGCGLTSLIFLHILTHILTKESKYERAVFWTECPDKILTHRDPITYTIIKFESDGQKFLYAPYGHIVKVEE